MEASPRHIPSLASSLHAPASHPPPPLARQAPSQWLSTHPFSAAAGASLPWFSAADPTSLRRQSSAFPRCDPSTPGPDAAAYLESIITASAPPVCQLRCQAGASERPANPLLSSDHHSQSARSFARSDQLKPSETQLTNRKRPAGRRTHLAEMEQKPRITI